MKLASFLMPGILSALIGPYLPLQSSAKKQQTMVAEPGFEGQWSQPVNGLRARFKFSRNDSGKRSVRIEPYIELHNSSDVIGNISIAIKKDEIEYQLKNKEGADVPKGMILYSGFFADFGVLQIPHNSYLLLNVTGAGLMTSKDVVCHIDLGGTNCWSFTKDSTGDAFLEGKIVIDNAGGKTWSGELVVPKTKVPLQADGG